MFTDPSKLCSHSQNFCVHCLWGRTANPHKDKEKEGLRLWQLHYFRESACLVLLPSWPFTSPGWVSSWCPFASAQSSHWLITLHQGVPRLTFVFLFSCKMFNYEPNCLQMVFRITCSKELGCAIHLDIEDCLSELITLTLASLPCMSL